MLQLPLPGELRQLYEQAQTLFEGERARITTAFRAVAAGDGARFIAALAVLHPGEWAIPSSRKF